MLIADDNADMREYVARLLAEQFRVEVVSDGKAALAAARERLPDLVLTDVMMPQLDGFGLLKELRSDPRTSGVPVIMLSARAGEDSRVEGMESGADDYLAKPFSARELQARVTAHIQIARLRRESEQAIRESEKRFRLLFETMSEGFAIDEIIFDESGKACDLRYLELNPAFERHTGLKRSDIVGRTVLELFPDTEPYWFEHYGSVVRTGAPAHFQAKFGPLGRWFEVSAYSTGANQIAVVFFDITEQKHAEDSLREADRHKDEFLATLAHELRNPLAPIRNGLHLMQSPQVDPNTAGSILGMMDRQLTQLVRLVDDLLDVSRISQGKLELCNEVVDLAEVINSAVEASQPLIDQMGHELSIRLPEESIQLDGDLTRLSQVFLNLLSNAAKYSEPGGRIQVTAKRQDGDVVVTVKDTGIGMPPEMLSRIFDMFAQVAGASNRSQGGLGIGLTLVRKLVGMHGGSVTAVSDGLGHGSEFVVRLPAISSEQKRPSVPADREQEPIPPRRILVVDDNRDSATSLSMLLKVAGNHTFTAFNGHEALKAVSECCPDVVLLDIGLPDLDGYEVARQMRDQPWEKEPVLVALTGWGQDADREKSKHAGFDAHMVKPVNYQALLKLLADLREA